MHSVKRAIILAAGYGNRMQPVTLDIAKPLIKINGVRIIDTIISGLQSNGINEIYIVIGYLKEQFYSLSKIYPHITLIENPYFDTCNNISSLYVAREHLENAIILDGDQYIYNSDILFRNFTRSGYNAIWTDVPTSEWLLHVQNDNIISCSRDGGNYGWQLFSISRWTASDGKKLKYHLEMEFEKEKNLHLYWDDVVMFRHFKNYNLTIYPMKKDDVIEIDNYNELVALDESYKNYRR